MPDAPGRIRESLVARRFQTDLTRPQAARGSPNHTQVRYVRWGTGTPPPDTPLQRRGWTKLR